MSIPATPPPPGYARLYPTYSHPSYLQLTKLRRGIERVLDHKRYANGLHVLDMGCDLCPYKPLFLDRGFVYEGADLAGNNQADFVVDSAGRVPCPDASYDMVLSTQVLEHVEDPDAYLQECLRVLKPGGHLLLTTHGMYFYHPCPIDYWRWTGQGLKHIIGKNGFVSVDIQGLVGAAATSIFLFRKATMWIFPRFLGLRFLYSFLLQQCMMLADALQSEEDRAKDSMIFLVVAQKKNAAHHT